MVSSVKQGSWQDLTVWRWWVNIGETIQALTSLRLTWIFILHPTAWLHCVAGLCFLLSSTSHWTRDADPKQYQTIQQDGSGSGAGEL